MVIPTDLLGFVRAHEFDRVLSLYVADVRLLAPMSDAPSEPANTDARHLAHAIALLLALPATPRMAGAMCLYAEDGDNVTTLLPIGPVPMERWSTGPIIVPYLESSYADGFIIVHATDMIVSLSRLQRGIMHVLDECAVSPDDDECVASVVRKLVVIAGTDSNIVLGGAEHIVQRMQSLLPADLVPRCVLAPAMTRQTPPTELADCARPAIQEMLSTRQSETFKNLKTKAHLTRRASFGFDDVSAAAKVGAVDRLLVSGALWSRRPKEIEALTQQAIRSGALVDVVTPQCAQQLDGEAGGIAAGLRRAFVNGARL